MRTQQSRQPDLFGDAGAAISPEPMPPAFIERIRNELVSTRARARGAEAMPWSDLTQATLAELRFHSIADWLPPREAEDLRAEFKIEMARLYDIAAQQYEAEQAACC